MSLHLSTMLNLGFIQAINASQIQAPMRTAAEYIFAPSGFTIAGYASALTAQLPVAHSPFPLFSQQPMAFRPSFISFYTLIWRTAVPVAGDRDRERVKTRR